MHRTRRELTLKRLFKLLQTADRHARLLNQNTLRQLDKRKGWRRELFLNHKPAACETSTERQKRTFIRDPSNSGDWSAWRVQAGPVQAGQSRDGWRGAATFDHRRPFVGGLCSNKQKSPGREDICSSESLGLVCLHTMESCFFGSYWCIMQERFASRL